MKFRIIIILWVGTILITCMHWTINEIDQYQQAQSEDEGVYHFVYINVGNVGLAFIPAIEHIVFQDDESEQRIKKCIGILFGESEKPKFWIDRISERVCYDENCKYCAGDPPRYCVFSINKGYCREPGSIVIKKCEESK